MKIIDPLIDEGFKLLFGREGVSEPLLMPLLNSIFAGDPVLGNIVDIQFTNTEHPNEQIFGRGLRYDISCTTSTGHHFIVEMQKGEQKHLIERSEYYVARAIASQGFRGKNEEKESWDFSLMPVVGVFFCNFSVSGLEKEPVTYAGICNLHTGKPIGKSQCYVYIQLPNFTKDELECESQLDKWIYNIKNMGTSQRVSFKSDNDIFNYLNKVGSVAALNPMERDRYEAALRYSRDYHAVLNTAKEKAEAEGMAKGMA
ncbi:MAG: Rpn family recombination-promoting nuclease/putative transposase, partial [Muribaculaceae bacterium]|nr:Rpn family recombination-promoting nuclease/putative transposase [Muribaculaceae bacterium]